MQDMIPKGTGNSRFLKSVENFKALYPTYDAFVAAMVAGNLPVDFNGVNPDGVEQVGTALSASNILKTSTAAMYGLDHTAVPDDIFARLGPYSEHWWEVTHGKIESWWEAFQTKITRYEVIGSGEYVHIHYSDSYSIDQMGNITLNNPKSEYLDLEFAYEYTDGEDPDADEEGYETVLAYLEDAAATLIALAPCYFTIKSDKTVYYLPAGANYDFDNLRATLSGAEVSYTNTYFGELSMSDDANNPVMVVSAVWRTSPPGEITYERSPDRNAYPDSGTVDSRTYRYLGVPFESLPFALRWGRLSYIGNGTYGSESPNTVYFGFQPWLVVVNGDTGAGGFVWRYGAQGGYSGSGGGWYSCKLTWDGNKLSWYTDQRESGATRQHNSLGVTYTVTYFG